MKAATTFLRTASLALAWVVIAGGVAVAGLMVAFAVWDIARGRWVNLPLDGLFAVLGGWAAWGANRSRRRLVDSARR